MISSGMKRGLAATAVSALAVAGLPLLASTANAVTLNSSVESATDVALVSPIAATGSTKADGTDSTIRLEAVGGANVEKVRFEYTLGGAYNTIATVSRNDNGAFSHEWSAAGLDGAAALQIRAVGLTAADVATDTTAAQALAISNTAASVNITEGSSVGVFQKPDYDGAGADEAAQNVVVSGTASATDAAPTLQFWDADTDAAAGKQPGYAGTGTSASTTAPGATTGKWAGVLDITGYDYGASDELLVKATSTTDDAEAFALYKQSIATVTAVADKTTTPVGGTPATVTVTVKDQNGNPIAGAEVRSSDAAAPAKLTKADGTQTFAQGPGSAYYYANASASDAFEPEVGDKKSDSITVTQYSAAPTKLDAKSSKGAAFDFDENSTITVQVQDQNNNDVDTTLQSLQYYWVRTPFGGGTPERYPANGNDTQPVETNGSFTVALPDNEDGTYELYAGLSTDPLGNGAVAQSKVLTVKAGQASIVYAKRGPVQAGIGSAEVVKGSLELADGTGLPGRAIGLHYDRGNETGPDATGADAGFVLADNTIGTDLNVTTAADGSFQVTVKDAVEAKPFPETGGNIDATSASTGASNVNYGIDFIAKLTPSKVESNGYTPMYPNGATPGRPVYGTFEVRSADDEVLTNQSVTLTLDKGFFVATGRTGEPLRAGTPTAGADLGQWKSAGQSITLTTDGDGYVQYIAAIERDNGFDDDGAVTAKVTATSGGVSGTEDIDWSTDNPLNGGTVDIKFADAKTQESGVLPKAPLADDVYLKVVATDQFGNPVEGEPVQVKAGDRTWNITTDFGSYDVDAPGDAAADVTYNATWVADTRTYNNDTPVPHAENGEETLKDGQVVNWYAVDYSKSTFTLTHSGAANQPVGATVTETYTAKDQFGEPISELGIQFFRTGPDDLQDGEGKPAIGLGQDGKATYVFQGAKKGTATVTAVAFDDEESTVPQAQKTDQVSFGGDAVAAKSIGLRLTGSSKGKNDVLKANANVNGKGLKAVLYKNGKKVSAHKLNSAGNWTFSVKDTNGNKATRYTVKVAATATTKAGSATKSVK